MMAEVLFESVFGVALVIVKRWARLGDLNLIDPLGKAIFLPVRPAKKFD